VLHDLPPGVAMSRHASNRVVITGLGPVSVAGVGVTPFWDGVASGCVKPELRRLQTDLAEAGEFHIAAMPATLPGFEHQAEFLTANDFKDYRDLVYAAAAIELAVGDARLTYDHDRNNIGVIQAFEAPGMERAVASMFDICSTMDTSTGPPRLYEQLAPYYYNCQPFLYVHAVGKMFQFHGFSTSVHNACSSGAYAIELAAQQIRNGAADAMIVVGGEAFDTAVRIEWFKRLAVYSTDGVMRPFDADSTGFFVGEGGAALVLESAESAERRKAEVYAEYLGGSFSQQGWKHALPDVRSGRLRECVSSALSNADLQPSDIDLIVPHAAATAISDGYEARSVAEAFGERSTNAVVTAFKPYVGHTLAASGLMEAIVSLLAMKHGCVPGSPHTRTQCSQLPCPVITETTSVDVRTLLKLSTGFTGHDAATLYRHLD
jgi:3-oxoacyl-(acyl-carrier-protein) synthase